MQISLLKASLSIVLFSVGLTTVYGQVSLRGNVQDEAAEGLIGASVLVLETGTGNVTDFDGNFEVDVPSLPTRLVISYVGYANDTVDVASDDQDLNIVLGDNATTMVTVEVKGRRLSERQQQSALTMETLDNIAIKETPAANFYDGLGSLKDVDLTAASLGFKIINTRGFNSTSPVRSLQIIDGVDNQSPGLNFSLGNFLGASELDVNSVNIIVGASSAFYGPNAFNGVISMETKDPFLQQGLSATVKGGERSLLEGGIRWAQAVKNKGEQEIFAYKLNVYGFRANDWEANNLDSVDGTTTGRNNLGGYDAVNRYGDEFDRVLDYGNSSSTPFLGELHRNGYLEEELVDYDSENLKASALGQFRLQPSKGLLSPEVIVASNFSTGTTIYQGDNRFSLRDIKFYQHRVEVRQRDKFFVRGYVTHEDAGNSYDPYFTALILRDSAASNGAWGSQYRNYWNSTALPPIRELGIPDRFVRNESGGIIIDPETGRAQTKEPAIYERELNDFISANRELLEDSHRDARDFANSENLQNEVGDRLQPGTPEFEAALAAVSGRLGTTGSGTRFYDKSALLHTQGEYLFNDLIQGSALTDLDLRIGTSYRKYFPDSKGTVLSDTAGANIDTYEYGVYGGGTATLYGKLKASASLRLDKNKNFDYLLSPAASLVYSPEPATTLRASFSSALRNPTLSDQYLFYNVGPAILLGNLNGVNDLITIESLVDYLNTNEQDTLDYFDVAPIRPERVRTFEVGARTTLFEKLFVDATYYYSFYQDFIGFNFGVSVDAFNSITGVPIGAQAYRVAANATDKVTTQGFSVGLNYYFSNYFVGNANYSFNKLNSVTDDPIIPAFNTPKNKYNLGLSARDIPLRGIGTDNTFGLSVNYKWIEGFLFEGSPQFTGFIQSYGLLDAQVNVGFPSINTVLKLGASNILDNRVFQTYGGPRVGRLAYVSLTYELRKKP